MVFRPRLGVVEGEEHAHEHTPCEARWGEELTEATPCGWGEI